jgi:AAA+ ATPase superfamily predicted ATPase
MIDSLPPEAQEFLKILLTQEEIKESHIDLQQTIAAWFIAMGIELTKMTRNVREKVITTLKKTTNKELKKTLETLKKQIESFWDREKSPLNKAMKPLTDTFGKYREKYKELVAKESTLITKKVFHLE